jgi:hypothetical protein
LFGLLTSFPKIVAAVFVPAAFVKAATLCEVTALGNVAGKMAAAAVAGIYRLSAEKCQLA